MIFRSLLVLLTVALESSRNDAWSHSGRGHRGLYASLSSPAPPVTSSTPPLLPNNAVEAGHLYYVSTPLGNLQDVTLRALHILAGVDVILAEDTRTTLKLLSLLRITPKRVLAHHEHNWQQSTPGVVQVLREGRSVALVSDAGTPGISDPGAQLAAACAAVGLTVHPIPGPSAVLAALSVSGFNCVPFTFHGFVPARGRERGEVLLALLQARGVGVFFEVMVASFCCISPPVCLCQNSYSNLGPLSITSPPHATSPHQAPHCVGWTMRASLFSLTVSLQYTGQGPLLPLLFACRHENSRPTHADLNCAKRLSRRLPPPHRPNGTYKHNT